MEVSGEVRRGGNDNEMEVSGEVRRGGNENRAVI